ADSLRKFPDAAESRRNLLVAWFWMTTYGEIFAGLSGDYLQKALEELRALTRTGVPTWTLRKQYRVGDVGRPFAFRRARAKAFAIRLINRLDESGQGFGSSLFRDMGRRCLVQLFPRDLVDKEHYSSPSNRFVLSPLDARVFLERLMTNLLTPEERRA